MALCIYMEITLRDRIEELIKRTFDIFLISENRIDDSFSKVLGKIETPLEEDFSFTLMKS